LKKRQTSDNFFESESVGQASGHSLRLRCSRGSNPAVFFTYQW